MNSVDRHTNLIATGVLESIFAPVERKGLVRSYVTCTPVYDGLPVDHPCRRLKLGFAVTTMVGPELRYIA